MFIGDETHYTGKCAKPLWTELKELSPADHQLERTINYGVALLVATYRYDELSPDTARLVDQMLADEHMPTPIQTESGIDVDRLVADLQRDRPPAATTETDDAVGETHTE
ncbi:hypothetical protein [Haloarcula amylovorans]|uniref:hypothetical protein n=1 Tax=Haloarcula amylovorans TaxID=2562280 RepID=UPI0010761C5F|nr:hypothetical protein [Halomicroarcula amylolytica]